MPRALELDGAGRGILLIAATPVVTTHSFFFAEMCTCPHACASVLRRVGSNGRGLGVRLIVVVLAVVEEARSTSASPTACLSRGPYSCRYAAG